MKNKPIIKESIGLFPGCQEKAEQILKAIRKYWTVDSPNNPYLKTPFKYNSDKFILISPTKASVRAAFLYNKSQLKYYADTIAVNPKILMEGDDTIIPTLMHELTHVYENANREKTGGSILKWSEQTPYQKSTVYHLTTPYWDKEEEWQKDDLSDIFYNLSEIEINAMMAGMMGKLFQHKLKDFPNTNSIIEFLRKTKEYDKIDSHIDNAIEIMNCTDQDDQKYYLDAANSLSNNRFRSFNDLKKYLGNTIRKARHRLEQMMPKIVSAFVERNRIPNDVGNVGYNAEYPHNKVRK